jgi:hypothetical protein
MPTLNAKLAPLKTSLTAGLMHSLSALDNRKTVVVKLVSLLLRLGAGPAARSTLLAARSEVTKKRVRMIRFEGAVEQYINDLAVVVFTGIKHTADWFLASFKENDMASGMSMMYSFTDTWFSRSTCIAFIDWAKFQIQDFATMFRKQVYTSDVDQKTVEDALTITYTQSKKVRLIFAGPLRCLLGTSATGRIWARFPLPPPGTSHREAERHPSPSPYSRTYRSGTNVFPANDHSISHACPLAFSCRINTPEDDRLGKSIISHGRGTLTFEHPLQLYD